LSAAQLDQSRELEVRLEQALLRWYTFFKVPINLDTFIIIILNTNRKKEKELVHSETARCSKLRAANVELLEKNQKQNFELERMVERLMKYDSLPMPEELKMRLKDFEDDSVRQKEQIALLEDAKSAMSDEKIELASTIHALETKLDENSQLIKELNVTVYSIHIATLSV